MSTIRDILGRKGRTVLTSKSSASVLEAISLMSQANIGALVIQDDAQPCGIFTERDYLRKIALKGRSSSTTALYDVMSAPLITVAATDSPEVAMEIMTTCRCRHLIVTENDRTRIVDWGSKNGITVNRRPVSEQVLRSGDIVTIGNADFRYEERPKR